MAKEMTLEDISEAMRDIDICMMATIAENGGLESRPMSNNREVAFEGDAYFFAHDSASAVHHINASPKVNLAFQGKGKSKLYLSIAGRGEIIRERARMEKHWVKDVEVWFEQGLDTPGIVLIKVHAEHIKYWQDEQEGEIKLN